MSTIEVIRGDVRESRHALDVVVCDARGAIVTGCGDADEVTFYRSAAKPLQALPLVEDGVVERFGLSAAELALCCASHQGEQAHLAGARSILTKAGLDESLLQCGPHTPFAHDVALELARSGREPERVHNNCSGKHAGMLALAAAHGWEPEDYHVPDHPVQRRMAAEVVRWTELAPEEVRTGTDGCGVVCFAVPLRAIAASFARFSAAASRGEAPAAVVRAMSSEPFMVGGTGRTCTDVMREAERRAFVKLGAEGVYAGGMPERGLGFALKVRDGARRAADVAVVHVLAALGALSEESVERLSTHARPTLRNTRGELVGTVRAHLDLRPVA